ncbi:hypothetical protein C8N46_11367 [Kordia periserrulae]|uniref:Uncharacterized protein n=1 Tax=Kordia periserrulae TaxID=701523 RepID=A0A2T6BRA2_9FLAO|nr:hypothetical protein C8N46_11367 [Kordia periserrulae]
MNSDELRKKWGVEASGSNDKNNNPPANENRSSVTESKYFKVDLTSAFIPSLKLIKKDGHVLFLPYSLQPVIEYIPSKGIYIKTMQQTIFITGRNLPLLLDYLGMQKVTWIKESANDAYGDDQDIFIKAIEIETEAV